MTRSILPLLLLSGCTVRGVITELWPDTDPADTDADADTDTDTPADDRDRDGFPASVDCDDSDPTIHPGAPEACDGVDQDCDGALDEGVVRLFYADEDGDGFGDPTTGALACDGATSDATDCDDADPTAFPGATEACDGVDDDCDGVVDDGAVRTWYIDYDRDGAGSSAYTREACEAPAGFVATDDDCDDANPAIGPSAAERCNGVDDDCDGTIDEPDAAGASTWYADADADGWGTTTTTVACDVPSGYVASSGDCDDTDADVHPGATEVCSVLVDADCDGVTPELCGSCLEHIGADPTATDGLYEIDPDGSGIAIEAWCDMSTDGGGWTLIQRTLWDWSDTSLLDTDYADWYGSTLGDPDTGNAYRLAGELWSLVGLDHELLAVHVPRDGRSGADCDPLYYQGTGATFKVSSTAATVSRPTSSASLVDGPNLVAADSTASNAACVTWYDAVPWFYSYCCQTCPSFFYGYWTDEAHPMAYYLDTTDDLFGNKDADVCPSGAAVSSNAYEGINTMEIFVR